jgi:hypothetical protein
MDRIGRILAAALASVLLCACFVLDEIDAGQEFLDKHGGAGHVEEAPKPTRSAPAKAEDESSGLLARVASWWEKRDQPAPPQRDPEDVPVRCELGGSVLFTRKFDCQVRGGRVL